MRSSTLVPVLIPLVASVVTACSAPDGLGKPTRDTEGHAASLADTAAPIDSSVDTAVDSVAEPPLSHDAVPSPGGVMEVSSGTQLVWLAFDGLTVDDCSGCSNAETDSSWLVGHHFGASSIAFPSWSSTQADRDLVAHTVRSAFAAYDVSVTTARPTSGSFTTVVITDHASGPASGVAPLDCGQRNASDVTFVYKADQSSVEWVASAAVHELGHSFGLTHVLDDADWMWWTGLGDRFTVSEWDEEHSSYKCMTGTVQDGPDMLLDGLGAAVPPPPWWSGSFSDDEGSVHEGDIDKIFAAGITVGCGGSTGDPRFCPDDVVTRGQMVVFLERALNLPASSVDHFEDDDGSWYEGAANAAADAGITFGCGTGRFCGDDPVLRDQMASFLARAFDYPSSSTDAFDDDDGNTHEANIDAIAAVGVTAGCGVRRYCPGDEVTRAQMASFLSRALGL